MLRGTSQADPLSKSWCAALSCDRKAREACWSSPRGMYKFTTTVVILSKQQSFGANFDCAPWLLKRLKTRRGTVSEVRTNDASSVEVADDAGEVAEAAQQREVVTEAVGVEEEARATPLPAPVMWHQQGPDLPGTSLVYVDEEEVIHLQKKRKLELALLEESIMAQERKQEAEQAKYMYGREKKKTTYMRITPISAVMTLVSHHSSML
ncbi:uncharacterized protein LOC123503436 [Portunus trituberculatus]|uniref:uncharacterized protein LOC123503436 n=1 Tax=Portunus trituberculatus TaxID=210409 RepID=UPI001E1D16E5|nr:uncharacterized protein LOC123503436 [Portunus trituberculatus]